MAHERVHQTTAIASTDAFAPPGRARVLRRRNGGEWGQSLAELALITPVLLMLVFGIIDFGMGLRAYMTVTAATREGARYASVGNPAGTFTSGGSGQCNGTTTTTAVGKVCATMNGLNLANVQNVSVTYPSGNFSGNPVRVQTTYRYRYITPIKGIINVLSGGSVPSYYQFTSSVDMRLE
jgi:Flp pilus assembly protein TadG